MKNPFRRKDIDDISERMLELETALAAHFQTEFTRAHPRTGDPEMVKKYLGMDSAT